MKDFPGEEKLFYEKNEMSELGAEQGNEKESSETQSNEKQTEETANKAEDATNNEKK